MISDIIEQTIKQTIRNHNNDSIPGLPTDIVATDNIGEVIEKLVILHIRVWMLEDLAGEPGISNEKLGEIKRKIDICFKQKRPSYIKAINALIDNSIKTGNTLSEDTVKSYKGF